MKKARMVASAFVQRGLDQWAIKPIAEALITGALEEVAKILSLHTLDGASLKDFERLCDALIMFWCCVRSEVIDGLFVKAKATTIPWSLIEQIHSGHSALVKDALIQEEWCIVKLEQRHITILGELLMTTVTSFKLGDDVYSASRPLLILLEFIFEYIWMAEEMFLPSDDVTVMACESVRLFAAAVSVRLLQPGCISTLSMLAVAAAGLHFYAQLVPFIKLRLVRIGARLDLVEYHSNEAEKDLRASCNEVLKRIGDVLVNAVETELNQGRVDTTPESNEANGIAPKVLALCKRTGNSLPTSLRGPVFDRICGILSSKWLNLAQESKEGIVAQTDIGHIDLRQQVCEAPGRHEAEERTWF
jgi:hypothetical protein